MSLTDTTESREVIGHNNPPDWAAITTEAMTTQYADLMASTATMLAGAQELPKIVESPEDSEIVSKAVKDLRDTSARAEAARVAEKEEFLRKGNAVDQFFKGLQTRLNKGADILHARVHNYNERRRIAEEERRRRELAEAQRIAREAQKRLAEEQRLRADAERAAARARKPENIEAHEQRAEQHDEKAESARVDTLMATAAADEARLAALQPAAEMVRERFDNGVLNTMGKEGYVEITDIDQIDLNALRPYLKDEHVLAALKAFAKKTSYKKPMAGAIIEMRHKTVIR